ncbi:MAG TPA: hypothetical protein VKR56_03920 [Candidatus Cybelea sp.]|nr:hypothetical protein [Candidatus Cybelea sp.]
MSDPRRPCDVVMKGGITSGVVYPAAICEIAKAFDLKGVGGSSAGAIAAALAAAAQYRRYHDAENPEAGYEQLATIPDWLATDENLFNLFAPDDRTRPLFETVVALMTPQPMASRARRLIASHWLSAALGALPGILYFWAAWYLVPRPLIALHVLAALLVLVAGAIFGSALKLGAVILRELPKNDFGMVKGAVTEEPGGNERPERAAALCSWLAGEFERMAGLDVAKTPLTFGMLWDPLGERAPTDKPPAERAINLEMITTSLTMGRPFRFPCSTAGLYFREDDLKGYVPKHVIDWMVAHPREGATPVKDVLPLPAISDLPVIVATRLSLSFPILLSAVPLYAVDRTAAAENQSAVKCWFSDGGICSNFPIALFDTPLPRWPTLAINLGPWTPRTPETGVYMPLRNEDGRLRPFSPIGTLVSFVSAIFFTMQNWNDDVQSTLSGFRDRIATISLRANEGGLNLEMSAEILDNLKKRGVLAGQMLRERFDQPSNLEGPNEAMNWENHRWLRYRTTMDAASRYMQSWHHAYTSPLRGDVTFEQLLEADHGLPMHSYKIEPQVRQRYIEDAKCVATAAAALSEDDALQSGSPKPPPELVLRAEI